VRFAMSNCHICDMYVQQVIVARYCSQASGKCDEKHRIHVIYKDFKFIVLAIISFV